MGYDSASVMSSELESSSFVDSEEDEDASRWHGSYFSFYGKNAVSCHEDDQPIQLKTGL